MDGAYLSDGPQIGQVLANLTQTADDSTRVEVLIAANLVFVAGIFVIPNVDAFFGYT